MGMKAKYKFPVAKCGNCGQKLEVIDEVIDKKNPGKSIDGTVIDEAKGFPSMGQCPKCFCMFEMVKK